MSVLNKKIKIKPGHYLIIDVIRGSAIIMMVFFHFCFNLAHFGYADFDFYHSPFWLNFRTLIVSTFAFVMGMSIHLANNKNFNRRKYLKRLGLLGLCALLITVTTYFMNSKRYIYFGILHFIFVASIFSIPFIRLYWTNLILGSSILFLNLVYTNPVFNQPFLQWIGFMTHKPSTEDYAPLIPWFGVVLIGMFAARWAISNNNIPIILSWRSNHSAIKALNFSGVNSLLIYMVHQPIFYGLFYLIVKIQN